METDVFLNDDIITDRFKSYYVVWKPDVPSEHVISDISFKSYYVVWKHTLKDNPKLFENV